MRWKLNEEQKNYLIWWCVMYGMGLYALVYFGYWFLAIFVFALGVFDLKKKLSSKEGKKEEQKNQKSANLS